VPPWYETFFNEDYLRIYAPSLPAARSAREVADIERLLSLEPGSCILDLCCGYGRHAVRLAARGYQVVGLDRSEVLLLHAQTEAEMQQVQVRWVRSDMTVIPFENAFDVILSVFTSFGYFEREEEDQRVLEQVDKALKPGGIFLLDTNPLTRVACVHAPSSVVRYDDGLIVVEERYLDLVASRQETRVTLFLPDGGRTEYQQSIRVYTLTELIRMCASVGLVFQAAYGGLDGSLLSPESRLVLLARKEGGSRDAAGALGQR
jgi:SAM-dependent methyltransferase